MGSLCMCSCSRFNTVNGNQPLRNEIWINLKGAKKKKKISPCHLRINLVLIVENIREISTSRGGGGVAGNFTLLVGKGL